jgi:predicted extracellular nuclease
MKIISFAFSAALLCSSAKAAVLISQYYEGTSTNKWIEITNTGSTAVDLGTGVYKLSLWTNASAEGYKTNGAPTQTVSLSGSLAAGASFVYGNTANTTPTYMVGNATANNNNVINFNGNDSVGLWTGATFSTVSLVDAVGFTNSGNEGVDKSFVRISSGTGWNTTAGSDILDFSAVWQQVTLVAVSDATAGTDARLGFSSIPEPRAALLGGLGILALLRRRRF